jgi:predicted O-methyltransferase YrrM
MRGLKPFFIAAERAWLPIERARLSFAGDRRLAQALVARRCAVCDQIEQKRSEMLKDNSPLVDGSLGPAAIYDEGQRVADVASVSKPRHAARLLHSLAAEYRPKAILELGTNVGISSAYMAAAGSRVVTLDASPYRQRLARKLHQSLGLNVEYVQGLFTDTLAGALDRVAPVEMAFIDGHHQYRPTLDYFEAIVAGAAPGCVFIFDDIRWSAGMRRAWSELRRDARFEAVADLGGVGVGILAGGRDV